MFSLYCYYRTFTRSDLSNPKVYQGRIPVNKYLRTYMPTLRHLALDEHFPENFEDLLNPGAVFNAKDYWRDWERMKG